MSETKLISDSELKTKLAMESGNTTTTTAAEFPTEIVNLPSRGWFYEKGHPLSNGTVEIKYMTAKEEDILTSQTLIKQGIVIDKLLQALLVTKFDFNDLLIADKNALIYHSRVLAYGKDYEVEVTCPQCDEKTKQVIDLTTIQDKDIELKEGQQGKNYFEFELPTSKIKVGVKLLTHGDEKNIEAEVKGLKKVSSIIDKELTTRLKYVIASVNGNTDNTKIREFVDKMLSRDSLSLRKFINEFTPDIKSDFNFVCKECGHEETRRIPMTVSFFWPGV